MRDEIWSGRVSDFLRSIEKAYLTAKKFLFCIDVPTIMSRNERKLNWQLSGETIISYLDQSLRVPTRFRVTQKVPSNKMVKTCFFFMFVCQL